MPRIFQYSLNDERFFFCWVSGTGRLELFYLEIKYAFSDHLVDNGGSLIGWTNKQVLIFQQIFWFKRSIKKSFVSRFTSREQHLKCFKFRSAKRTANARYTKLSVNKRPSKTGKTLLSCSATSRRCSQNAELARGFVVFALLLSFNCMESMVWAQVVSVVENHEAVSR